MAGSPNPRTHSPAHTKFVETCVGTLRTAQSSYVLLTLSSMIRLIDTESGEFVEFVDPKKIPPYAILSHTWDKDREQTYQEVVRIQDTYRHQLGQEEPRISVMVQRWYLRLFGLQVSRGSIWDTHSGLSQKVRKACEIARRDGYRYIWIDSCCINKESSSELSEAINTMFNWYRTAQICYAFLVDVPSDKDPKAWNSDFRKSRWFRRGWTLQELVSPRFVVFLSKDWKGLGTKQGLAEVIQEITSIDVEILTHKRALSDESVANRMGWASTRDTTRVEDKAYSLLGIFGITMSTLYGEGEYAFRRLQEEILRRILDQTIFAWGSETIVTFPMTLCQVGGFVEGDTTLLASSPHDFTMKDNRIIPATKGSIASLQLPVEDYTHTPYGIRTHLCLLPLDSLNQYFNIRVLAGHCTMPWYLAILRAQKATNPQGLLGRLCYLQKSDEANVEFLYLPTFVHEERMVGLYEISPNIILGVGELENHWKTVYLPHPKPSELESGQQLLSFKDDSSGVHPLSLTIPMWGQDVLRVGGFTVSDIRHPTENHRNSLSFNLIHAAFDVYVMFSSMINPCWFSSHNTVIIKARAWILPPGNKRLHTTRILLSPSSDCTTWVARRSDRELWDASLPSQCLNLTPDFRDKVTVLLSLGLDLTTLFQYTLRVDDAPQVSGELGPSLQNHWKDTQPDEPELGLPYKTLDFILQGSTRSALERKGYSAHLALEPGLGDTHSHCLTLSTDTNSGKFVIVVKYLQVHTLGDAILARTDLNPDLESDPESESTSPDSSKTEQIVIIARITLVSSDGGFETMHDGPHVVAWDESYPFNLSLGKKEIVLTTPTGNLLALQLGFYLAWRYEYYLHVDVTPRPPHLSSTLTRITSYNYERLYLPGWAHRGISLTLPTHVNRALQAQGFQVGFERLEGGGASGDPIHHLLTLSHTRAGVTIVIKYLHGLTTEYLDPHFDLDDPEVKERYPLWQANPQLDSDSSLSIPNTKASVKRCRQELTFKTSIHTSTSRSVQTEDTLSWLAVCDNTTGAELDWEHCAPWQWHLDRKDITLTLSTGRQLLLRFCFDLVWYSEYCLTVEINPQTPLPRREPWDPEPAPMPDYELGDDGMEYIRQASAQRAEPGLGQSAEALNDYSGPFPADYSTLEQLPFWSGEPEDLGNSDAEEQPREGVVVEAEGEATELVAHSKTQSRADHDKSNVDGEAQ